jgi:hypothetical protein
VEGAVMTMFGHRARTSLVAAVLALCPTAFAQEPVPIESDVTAVVTGGYWSSGALNGVYRVVVRTGGREHTISSAQIDWIAESANQDGETRVVQSKIAKTGSWRLDRPRILKSGNVWRVELDGLETHFEPAARGKWVLRLGAPGDVQSALATRLGELKR